MCTHSGERMSSGAFRLRAWPFKVADFFHPKPRRLAGFGLREGFVVVDYGCGPGRYVAEASRRAGPAGKVYTVDIHPLAIQRVMEILPRLGPPNVAPLLAHNSCRERGLCAMFRCCALFGV